MNPFPNRRLPPTFVHAVRRLDFRPSRLILDVNVSRQRLRLFERMEPFPDRYRWAEAYRFRRECIVSTSAWGIGQIEGSNRTPLGLHQIQRKVGGGWPVGTVFRSRQVTGWTWQGQPEAAIAHRILWLDGLEPGFNRGGQVDTFRRYIYIHGVGNERTLGRPSSHGCVHLSAADLFPLYDRVTEGTLVWIAER